MQRGPSQRQRVNSKSINNNNHKTKQAHSKNKRFIQNKQMPIINTKNSTTVASPLVFKELNYDKQNIDVLHSVLKIISAAAQSKQKQILLSIAAQIDKQKKIKSLLPQKQSGGDTSQLQMMLTHLKHEQLKQIHSLKIQIAKRKLQNLDENDLRENILSLNSFVMRRSKKETIAAKNNGVDLIGQIYKKFDDQQKMINQASHNQKINSRYRSIRQSQILIANKKDATNFQELANIKVKQNESDLNKVINGSDVSVTTSSQSQLMQKKIVQLEKQNLRLMKEFRKIQQQFQCVVEQKLLLEDKIQKFKALGVNQKDNALKCLKQLRDNITNQGSHGQFNRQQINGFLTSLHKKIQQQIKKLQNQPRDSINQQDTYEINNVQSLVFFKSSRLRQSQNYEQMIIKSEIQEKIRQNQQQNNMMQRYQNILTQKQIQINKYLKVISKMKEEKLQIENQHQISRRQLQNRTKSIQKYKDCIRQLQQQIRSVKFQFCVLVQTIKQKFKEYGQMSLIQMSNFMRQTVLIQNCNMELRNYNKQLQTIINANQQKIRVMSSKIVDMTSLNIKLREQMENTERKLQQQRIMNDKQKQKLIEQMTNIQSILAVQKTKVQDGIKDSMHQEKIKFQDQVKKYQGQIEKVRLQSQELKNSLIEQCGMLLQQKSQQINQIYVQVQRQKLINQDLISFIREKQTKQRITKDILIQKVRKLKDQIQGIKNQLSFINKSQSQFVKYFLLQFSQTIFKIQNRTKQLNSSQCYVNKQLYAFSNVYNLLIEGVCQKPNYIIFIRQISQLVKKWIEGKEEVAKDQTNQGVTLDKMKLIRDAIENIKKQALLYRQEKDSSIRINTQGNQMKNLNFQKQYEILVEANSPQEHQSQQKGDSSSFLNEIKPFQDQRVFSQNQILLSDIINQSGFIQQVEALRKQLAESFKRIEVLQGQLKLYQQKDIDKIFDF